MKDLDFLWYIDFMEATRCLSNGWMESDFSIESKENNMSYFHNGSPASSLFFVSVSPVALTEPPQEMISQMFAGDVKTITGDGPSPRVDA